MSTIHIKGKNDPRLPLFSFLAAAAMDKKEKHNLHYLFYEAKRKRLWATDGHRAHIAFIDMGEENRVFDVVTKKKGEILLDEMTGNDIPQAPNISIILSNIRVIARQAVSISNKTPELAYVNLMRLWQKAIIRQYFFDDLALFSNTWTALIQDGEESAIAFKSEKCLAVIMPINV